MHPEDVRDGWKQRFITIRAKKPTKHSLTVNGAEFDMPILVCDFCNAEIPDGNEAVAHTMWRGVEPENWEKEFSAPNENSAT